MNFKEIKVIRKIHITQHISCNFWEDKKLTLSNYLSLENYQELPWFDPIRYSDQELVNKIKTLITFS